MKARYFTFVLTVLAVSIVSCTREDGKDTAVEGPVLTFTAIHADSKDTKTALQDNGTSIWWTSNEQINIFYGTKFKGQFSSGNSEPQATTTFSGSLTVVTGSIESGAADAYWAVYPYDEANTCDGESVTLTVPSTQTGVAGTFADNFFPAIATSTTLDLAFYNVCGGARFSVSQTGITSIKVSSKNTTPIAGKVRVGFGANGKPEVKEVLAGESEVTLAAPAGGFVPGEYYYAALLPGTHSDGLDVIFEKDDNTMGTYQISKNLEVHRALFGKLSNLDEGLNFGPNPKATIQFEDPIAKYACVEKFDTNGDGEVSYEEAAAATSLEGLFTNWNTVTRFDEIKYFTGVSTIEFVFKGLKNLESITIPENIKAFSLNGTFSGCTSLKTVVLPDTLPEIPGFCFSSCIALTNVSLPSNILAIPVNCFEGCSSLSSITLPPSVKSIHDCAFINCSALTSIEFPAGLETVGSSAFRSCSSLSSLVLPNSLLSIGNLAFAVCTNLTSVTIPSGTIDRCAFQQCDALSSVVLPSDMSEISDYLFSCCGNLTSVTWPDNVTSIGVRAFEGCTFAANNYTIELPASITQIGTGAFSQGPRHIIIPSTSAVSIGEKAFGELYAYLYVPAGMIEMYKVRSNWNFYAEMIRPLSDYPVEPNVGGMVGEAVDLGLSVKWSSWNLGATKPQEYGAYISWGETCPTWDYNWSSYKFRVSGDDYDNVKLSKYYPSNMESHWGGSGSPDNKTVLEPEDDAASFNWGGSWRMPTDAEWKELIDNCTWTWTSDYNGTGMAGRIVTSNMSGHEAKSIFLPAAGYRYDTSLNDVGTYGYYWSSSLCTGFPVHALIVRFRSDNVYRTDYGRFSGYPIRPVCPKD